MIAVAMNLQRRTQIALSAWVLGAMVGCSSGSEAQRRGVGAECAKDADCVETGQRCLTQFKGGYCGLSGCASNLGCPAGSACVAHADGANYCFLICIDKPDCNRTRSAANEANCSSSAVLVDVAQDRKVCTPPNGG